MRSSLDPITASHRASRTARRIALVVALLLTAGACSVGPSPSGSTHASLSAPTDAAQAPVQRTFARLEAAFGSRLGVYAVDTASGAVVAHRADERFAYASTHKVFTVAALLDRTPVQHLNRRVPFGRCDLVYGAPVTREHVGAGMTLRELMDAALRFSDNTADDLLFREIGGPAALAGYLRGIGDTTSHVDRIEPELNRTAPGDIRDTSTPRALAADLRGLVLGTVLPEDRRAVLTDMMRANTTGATTIRAGVPGGWQVADKTGTAGYATRNDIAVLWPPARQPVVLVVLSDRPGKDDRSDDALIAQATAATVAEFR